MEHPDPPRRADRVFRPAAIPLMVALASAAVLAAAVLFMAPPKQDLLQLALYLVVSGGVSLALGYAGLAAISRFGPGGLRLHIALGQLLVLVVGIVDVVVTATLMFVSQHDLALLGLLLFFATAMSVFISLAFADMIAANLRVITVAAARMRSGDMSARAELVGSDEVGDLATTFNTMAIGLQEGIERERIAQQARRDLIAAVSHDLRTPLASIGGMVEAIDDGVVSDQPTVQRYLQNTRREIGRLGALIDELFELSQIDAGELTLEFDLVSLRDLISDTLASLKADADKRGVLLVGAVEPASPSVRLDPAKIGRVLDNLICNALVHTQSGGAVEVRASVQMDHVEITVQDDGEGIGAEQLPHIFEPFYRGEPSRSRDGGGGLGLAIAQGIVEAHGGRIWAESTPGTGTSVHFTLPGLQPSSAAP